MIRRVVVTGLGIISPVGNNTEEAWSSLLAGQSGIGSLSTISYPSFPAKAAGEVKNFNPRDYHIKPKSLKLMNRTIQFAIAASGLAMTDAGICEETYPPENAGLALGVDGVQYSTEEFLLACYESTGKDLKIYVSPESPYADISIHTRDPGLSVHPLWSLSVLANMSLCHISIQQQLQGPNLAFSSIDASGAHAIGEAFRSIQYGESDLYLAGGSYALNTMTFMSLSALGLLSDKNETDPVFDACNKGLLLGEGAVVMVLEEKEAAKKRGARIYAEINGYASSYGSSSFVDLSLQTPDASGLANCIQQSLTDASLSPAAIDFINADGRPGIQGRSPEIAALESVFGENAGSIPVSTAKSLTGHMLPATGAFDAASTVLSIYHDLIPPAGRQPDNEVLSRLHLVTRQPLATPVHYAVSNTFGISGEHTSLVFTKHES